jgi:hypothetical protein
VTLFSIWDICLSGYREVTALASGAFKTCVILASEGSESTIPDKRLTTLLADWERPEAAEELRPEADAMVELATVEDC